MAGLGVRIRLVGRLLRAVPGASITSMSDEQIRRAQLRRATHNRVSDAVFGAAAPGVEITERTLPDGVRLRVYRPAAATGPLPLVLNLHGGGWTLGSADTGDWLCSSVSSGVGAVVVSVDYRLAPTHRFPAAVEDSYAALEWCAEHGAQLGADPSRLAVMGDSAGGNLAAVLCLLARDRSGPAIAQQSLLYPSTDLTLSGRSMTVNVDEPVLSVAELRAFRQHYLGDRPGAERDPMASPLLAADHSGLPPAVIQVAEHDPLLDDGVRYAQVLRAAGVPVRFTEYVGMPHGYLSFPGLARSAPQALNELTTALTEELHK